MDRTKNMNLPVVRELPAELASRHPADDDQGVWVWATREVIDTAGDVVRVDGIDMGLYHNPPETHLKVLAQHIRNLPDGKSPVVGLVKDYVKTVLPHKGRMVKGLALWIEWLRDSDTKELLELAAHYRQMVKAGGIDSVSIGFIMTDYEPFEDGGLDIHKSALFECSFVTIPANASATLVKQIGEGLHGYLDEEGVKKAQEKAQKGLMVTLDQKMDRMLSFMKADLYDHVNDMLLPVIQTHVDSVKADLAAMPNTLTTIRDSLTADVGGKVSTLEGTLASISKSLSSITERLDTLDSAVVVLTEGHQAKSKKLNACSQEQLRALSERLDRMTKFVSN